VRRRRWVELPPHTLVGHFVGNGSSFLGAGLEEAAELGIGTLKISAAVVEELNAHASP